MSKRVVVTGGSRGIGLSITRALVEADYDPIVVARSSSDALKDMINRHCNVRFVAADLSQLETLPALGRSLRQFGPIWGLVNNAGIGTAGVLGIMPNAQIAQMMTMNAISPITLTKYILKSMMAAQNGGRIINISSIVAKVGYPGLAAYSASKAALEGFTRSLAREVGRLGITVNAVAPGFVATEMTHGLTDAHFNQIKRRNALNCMISANDIAAAVTFLLGDKAANITGTIVTVDAGNTV